MLLTAALIGLSGAVALGVVLAGLHLMELEVFPRWGVLTGYVHGVLGAAGTVLLLVVLTEVHTAAFARMAAVLLAGALLGGAAILTAHLRRRGVSAVLIGLHASAGVAGAVLLAASVSTGQ